MKHCVKNTHILAAVVALGALGQAQSSVPTFVDKTATPKFEVASIKPADPSVRGFRIQTDPGGRYIATGVTVKFLIAQAYGVRDFQVSAAPGWTDSVRYDINAKGEDGIQDKPGQMDLMLQDLLADRFHLKLNRETKEMPIYALVAAKAGSKLKESTKGEDERGMRMGRGRVEAQSAPIAMLAIQLSQQLGRLVLDKTGLTGNYDFKLEWTPDLGQQQPGAKEIAGTETAPPDSGPTIFTALQEQLGLKLESTKGPVEMLVIDRVEKPTEN
jgi:bla regulator protein BlaR1